MSKKIRFAEFLCNQPQALIILRAFALSFPSLETVPWSTVLGLFFRLNDPDPTFFQIQEGLELSGYEGPEKSNDWRGWYDYHPDLGVMDIYPNVGDRFVQITTIKDDGKYKYYIRVDCEARPSRRAMSHLIQLIETGMIIPVRSSWIH